MICKTNAELFQTCKRGCGGWAVRTPQKRMPTARSSLRRFRKKIPGKLQRSFIRVFAFTFCRLFEQKEMHFPKKKTESGESEFREVQLSAGFKSSFRTYEFIFCAFKVKLFYLIVLFYI